MKNFKKCLPFVVVIFFIVIVGIFLNQNNKFESRAPKGEPSFQVSDIKFVKIAGQMVKVDLALTPETQEQGLSGRKSLASDAGMLFVFPKLSINYFWMKDMNFPIDMIWIGEDLKVIYIKKDAQPSSYPDSFGPGVDNRYVLEVLAGFSEKNNLKVGDRVEFLR